MSDRLTEDVARFQGRFATLKAELPGASGAANADRFRRQGGL
jgi:hypothetical protein